MAEEEDPFVQVPGPVQDDEFSAGAESPPSEDPFANPGPPQTVGDAFSEAGEQAAPAYDSEPKVGGDPFTNDAPQSPLSELPPGDVPEEVPESLPRRFDNESLSGVSGDSAEEPPPRRFDDESLSGISGDTQRSADTSSASRAPSSNDRGFTFSLHVHIPSRTSGAGAQDGGWTFDMEAHTSCSIQAPGGKREHFRFGPADPSSGGLRGDGSVSGRITGEAADSSSMTQEFSISRGQYESVHEYFRGQTRDGQMYGETTLQYTRAGPGGPGEADSTSFTFRAAEHAHIDEVRRYEGQSPQDVAKNMEMERRLDELERGFALENAEHGPNRRAQQSELPRESPPRNEAADPFGKLQPGTETSPSISEPSAEGEHVERRAPRRAR